MSIDSFLKGIKYIIIIVFILSTTPLLYSQESVSDKASNRGYIESSIIPEIKKGTVIFREGVSAPGTYSPEEENLSELQKQARLYRNQGLELQRIDDLKGATSFYQKAIELDPSYAIAYNDLGIIYEANGFIDRAEQGYLQAIKIDPDYLSAYSNLALLYENKRDFDKAALYWEKRATLGLPDDSWTQKASQRLKDIRMLYGQGLSKSGEQEVIALTKDVLNKKYITRQDNRELAKVHFQKAKDSFEKQDEITALKEAINAQLLDPSNKEIIGFIEKIQTRLLTR